MAAKAIKTNTFSWNWADTDKKGNKLKGVTSPEEANRVTKD
ncbi:MAG: hypothetical protein Q8R10_07745 [Pseudomonas sp.]|nr:hypothetical protein [Pseudomonas sp.]MDP3846303.1 hypothetical protein [Pseudomonas sp.]